MTRDLAMQGYAGHPVVDAPGWWRRKDRLVWAPVGTQGRPEKAATRCRRQARPLLITGGSGRLGQAVVRSCIARGLPYRAPSRGEVDITDARAVGAALELNRPWAVVNAAAFTGPAAAETDPQGCRRANIDGGSVLAAACASSGIQLLAWSTHLVFDGRQRRPYLEGDAPAPRGVYATSKPELKRIILAHLPAGFAGPCRSPVRAMGSGENGRVDDPHGACGTPFRGCRGRHDLARLSAAPDRGCARSADRRRMRHLAPGQPGRDHARRFRAGTRPRLEARDGLGPGRAGCRDPLGGSAAPTASSAPVGASSCHRSTRRLLSSGPAHSTSARRPTAVETRFDVRSEHIPVVLEPSSEGLSLVPHH